MTIKTTVYYKSLPTSDIADVTGLTTGTFAGNGTIDLLIDAQGTSNVDTFMLNADLSDFNIQKGKESILVTHDDLPDVVLSMRDIERLESPTQGIAFDVNGDAGEIYALLATALGKDDVTPGLVGIGLELKDQGKTDTEIAQILLSSTVYKEDALGSSNETLVKQIYKNILGTTPSLADLIYFTGLLDNGTFTQAQLLEVASNLELARDADHINLVGMASIEYTPFAV